jgi:hypothetical protein
MVFKNKVLRPGSTRSSDQYEFAFVRGRECKMADRLGTITDKLFHFGDLILDEL